jgi:hypothetical protein
MVPSGSRVFRAVLVPAAFRSWALVIHDDWCHIVGCESEMMMPLPPPHPPSLAAIMTWVPCAFARAPPRRSRNYSQQKKKHARLFRGHKRWNRHEDLLLNCAPASSLMCRNDSANRWVRSRPRKFIRWSKGNVPSCLSLIGFA